MKKWYHKTVKPIINIITLRHFRRWIKWQITLNIWKSTIISLEKNFLPHPVLIFQRQFLDKTGSFCFNGGAERYVQDLSEILIKKGFSPYLVQMGTEKLWQKKIGTLNVIGLPAPKNTDYKKMITLFSKYDFVIYSGAIVWGKKLLHPNIMISHGVTWDAPNKNFDIKKVASIFQDVDCLASVDTNTISWLRTTFSEQFSNKKMIFIPNYVDTCQYYPVNRSNQRVKAVFPRRASPERGYWLMSKVLPRIMEKYPELDFQFAGFVHTKEIEADIKRLCDLFPKRISHIAVKPDEMVKVYQSADISLVPTLYAEGTSLSCLEAQACGNAVISTNIGGLPNLIIDGYNGLLINPSESELEGALDTVMKNKKFRKNLQKNAVVVAQAFDKKIWDNRWEKLTEDYYVSSTIKK